MAIASCTPIPTSTCSPRDDDGEPALAGSHLLTAKLNKVLARKSIWPRKCFFRAKQDEHTSQEIDEMVEAGFLTALEARWLTEGRRFLWRVRFGLRLIAECKKDRLLFDY